MHILTHSHTHTLTHSLSLSHTYNHTLTLNVVAVKTSINSLGNGYFWKREVERIRESFRNQCLPFIFTKIKEHTKSRELWIIFIIKGFWIIVFIFIVISTTFWLICPPAFFRWLSNSGTFTELRTISFNESTGVACSDSVSHNRVLACCQDWTCNL